MDLLNISLDTLKPEKYEKITRRKGWERVIMGIDLALQLEFDPVKVNCVVMKGFNDDEILDFVEFTKDRNIDIRFIEYMPFTGNKWELDKMVPYNEMVALIRSKWPDFSQLLNGPNDVSKVHNLVNYFSSCMMENCCRRGKCQALKDKWVL